jgi:hypothetical protein
MHPVRIVSLVFLLAALGGAFVLAADKPADNWNILRDKLKADKKLVVADNLELTQTEADAFWPVYGAYQAELARLNERIKKAVLLYADAWNNANVTDETARYLVAEMLAIDEVELQLKKALAPKVQKVLPPLKAMRYLQIENKVRTIARYDLMEIVPLAY